MFNQILLVFAAVFAVIGLMTTLYAVVQTIGARRGTGARAEVALFITDSDSAEGVVREYAARLNSGLCGLRADSLAVVCPNGGEAREILRLLEGDISALTVYSAEEYSRHVKTELGNL